MKNKMITAFDSVIAFFYTFLIILAVDGFDRAGMINRVVDYSGLKNDNFYGVILFILCVVVLALYYIFISKRKNNSITLLLCTSFFIGALFLMLIIKGNSVQKYLFDCYISWFYHGVYYEGEEKVPQIFSFILRLVAFCFCCGGIITVIFVKFIKRNLIKV